MFNQLAEEVFVIAKLRFSRLYLVPALVATTLLTACTGGSGTSPSVSGLSDGVGKVLAGISSGAPHVITSGTVTASYKMNIWKETLLALNATSVAFAQPVNVMSVSSLATIWDPGSGTYPRGSQFGLGSNFNGGNLTGCRTTGSGSTAYSECTDGRTYYPNSVSVMSWIGQMLDPNFKNSNGAYITAFGRLQETMKITCAIGKLITTVDTDGLPLAGTYNLSFPADAAASIYQSLSSGGCGLDSSGMAGQSATAVVTAVSSATFTKKISVNVGNPDTIWLGLNLANGTFAFMQLEDQAVLGGRNKISRTIVKVTNMNNPQTSKTLFEFASQAYAGTRNSATCYSGSHWNCDWEFHRGVIDNSTDTAYLLTNRGDPGDNATGGTAAVDGYVQFAAAARPREIAACTTAVCTESLALSVGVKGQKNVDNSTATYANDYNGCVDLRSRTITSDSTLACSLTGVTIASGSPSGVTEQSRLFYAQLTSGAPSVIATTSENTSLSFSSGADIYTAATSQ